MTTPTFHAGEIAMQRAAGVHERLRELGPRVIRDHMPDQHREFFGQLPTLIVGSVDASQRPWASMLAGLPGFLRSEDAWHLRVDARPGAHDPLHSRLVLGTRLGLLGIEPQSRRRNRLNGSVISLDDNGFELRVEQSFGNCPKYIQARTLLWGGPPAHAQAARREGACLSDDARALVCRADTLFIASSAPGQGVDVSHRGGKPGFVRVDMSADNTVLTLPDFLGNFFFNTLGNIIAHPWAGLLFLDYETGDTLQLRGRANVIIGGAEVAAFAGAERLLRVEVEEGIWTPNASPLRWSAPRQAAQLDATGRW